MDKVSRFLLGGLGAALPIFVQLLGVDAKLMFSGFDPVEFAGWVVRCIMLFALGGLSVMFHASETSAWKLIQLGAGAPAMFLSTLNGVNARANVEAVAYFKPPAVARPAERFAAGMLALTTPAYASEAQTRPHVKDFSDKEPNKFWTTFFANKPVETHFVIAKETEDLRVAIEFARSLYNEFEKKDLLREETHLTVQLYEPYDRALKYTVVVAESLSHKDAAEVIILLLKNDFTGAEIWDIECMCYPDRQSEAK